MRLGAPGAWETVVKRSVRRAGFLLLRLVAAGVLSGCHRADAPSPKARYVDAGICGACHSDVYRTYRNTAMARSFSRPTPENTGGDFEGKNVFYHRPSDSYFSMSRRGGR